MLESGRGCYGVFTPTDAEIHSWVELGVTFFDIAEVLRD
jgi:hypothetical protein